MFVIREMDYGLRIVRTLYLNGQQSAATITKNEGIPTAFAYKVLKKLENSGIVEIKRGVNGGYRLTDAERNLTMFDILSSMGDEMFLNECLVKGYECTGSQRGNCSIQKEFRRIQEILEGELKRKTIKELLLD